MSSTLLLNADMQPVSLLPLSTVSWQEAIRYMVLGKVEVLAWYDHWIVRSERWQTAVPSVILLKEYQRPTTVARLSKRNVFLRDQYQCQYCGTEVTDATATLDHVHPISLGGKTTWENSTTACKPCNYKKGPYIDKMRPSKKPYKPHFWELVERRRQRGYHVAHASWLDFLL